MNITNKLIFLTGGLPDGLAEPFTAEEWKEKIPFDTLERLGAPLYLTQQCGSTLDVAHALHAQGKFPEWSSLLALRQTNGRGQLRRQWSSLEGNLFSSLRLPLLPPFDGTAAATSLGAFVVEGLRTMGFDVSLKWPNDLIFFEKNLTTDSKESGENPRNARKVGGILLEERRGSLIAGIGINLRTSPPAEAIREGGAFPAAALLPSKDYFNHVNIIIFWCRLAAAIHSCYSQSLRNPDFRQSLVTKYSAFKGRRVLLENAIPENEPSGRIPCFGIIDGVEPSGALRLLTDYGRETFLGGSLIFPEEDSSSAESLWR